MGPQDPIKRNLGATQRWARTATNWTGSNSALVLAVGIVVLWAATGPAFGYSDTWQQQRQLLAAHKPAVSPHHSMDDATSGFASMVRPNRETPVAVHIASANCTAANNARARIVRV
jgi:hypothetical protein